MQRPLRDFFQRLYPGHPLPVLHNVLRIWPKPFLSAPTLTSLMATKTQYPMGIVTSSCWWINMSSCPFYHCCNETSEAQKLTTGKQLQSPKLSSIIRHPLHSDVQFQLYLFKTVCVLMYWSLPQMVYCCQDIFLVVLVENRFLFVCVCWLLRIIAFLHPSF